MTTTSPLLQGLRLPRGAALGVLATSMFLIVLDGAMVNLAASTIRSGLGLTAAELTVVANSYLIAVAGLVLLGGRLADVLGARRMFLIGMSVYVAASALCALAVNGSMLIAGRVGQGLGAALTVPAALAIVLLLYTSAAERSRAIGIWGAVSGGGSLIGVFAGGTLTEVLGWQSVFWTPVPLGIVAAVAVWRTVPPIPGRPGRFDLAGAVSITLSISALAFSMVTAAESGWTAPPTLVALVVGLAALGAFVAAEHRSSHPLVPLSAFRRATVATATAVMVLAGGTLTSLFFFLPLYQQDVLGMGPLMTGLAQLPIAVMIIVGSVLAPLLAKLLGLARALPVSLTVLLIGILWIAINPATTFTWQHTGAFLLIGAGLGLGIVNGTTMAVRDSGDGESGLLSGLVNAAQSLGGAIGLAALAAIALSAAGSTSDVSFTAAFLGGAGLVALAIALSIIPLLSRRRTAAPTL
ncbi:MFS transporter [Promicromonospora umidemergens]|nr:MFS transporter [Promicromonospora umidemergens]